MKDIVHHLRASGTKALVEYFKTQFQKDECKQCPLYSKYAKTLKINEVDMLTPTKSEPDRIHLRNVPQIRTVLHKVALTGESIYTIHPPTHRKAIQHTGKVCCGV